jgi:hypothetical protein
VRRLLAALLLVASPALAQSNGWREAANGWGEIQTAAGGVPAACITAGMVPFLGSPVSGGYTCDSGLTYDAATDTLTVGAAGAITLGTDVGLSRSSAGVLKVTDGGAGNGTLMVSTIRVAPGGMGYSYLSGASGDQRLAWGDSDPYIYTANGILIGGGAINASPTTVRSSAANTLQLGAAPNATPVANTLIVGESGSGTDIAGANGVIQSGAGTGAGAGSMLVLRTPTAGASGAGTQTMTDRLVLPGRWTTLTESSATGIATVTFPASSVASVELLVTIEANDGTEYQVVTSRVRVSSVRKAAGNTISAVALVGTDLPSPSSGTLTYTATVTEGAAAVTVNANAVSSLTQTTLRANIQVISNGPGVTVAQP